MNTISEAHYGKAILIRPVNGGKTSAVVVNQVTPVGRFSATVFEPEIKMPMFFLGAGWHNISDYEVEDIPDSSAPPDPADFWKA